ncbi:nucleolar complex protein 2 homolog [Eriocheir sinensis]|uniref:nucleolar complex protein 2 homolog n=1 Tax=Eriocheir sinensis TaxID=95602 RepID=UPI0021C72686|nr:nucleolar complex protein 2 homolog [Eriocheir sinensis]XP_050737126.1 nucleolar complex protein 2 homolog [Eriocheir sinensis]
MKPKNKGGVTGAGLKRKKGRITPQTTIDDMFSMINDDVEDDSDEEGSALPRKKKQNIAKKKMIEDNDDLDFEEDEDLAGVGTMSRNQYLEKLKKSDPDFYATMMQSSDLMDLNSSGEDESEEEERGGAIFEAPDKLEVGSDESDVEDEELQKRGSNIVTARMINQWEEELQGTKPINTFLEMSQAFLAAIESLGSRETEEGEATSKYKIEGPQIFNAIVRLCLRNAPSAMASILKLKSPRDDPTKSKKWHKMRNFFKLYLRSLVTLTECMAEPSVAEVVLNKGVLPLLNYYAHHPGVCKMLLRRLITLWATSEKRVRVVAFVAIFRLAHNLPPKPLEWVLKRLYLTYVQNSRFTSPSTWGLIDFMRLSLVELYALDQVLAYKHAFVYIRQMAFHLRNAILVKKKERIQLVYNWQYVHCLHLWAELLSKTHPSPALQPIVYPLTQVAIGTIKLQPTPSFFPLVFHVCGILTDLSRHTGTFIPVLPFLLEVLNKAPLAKKHKKASIRPFDWLCMLRLSRAEMSESGFKDGVVDQVYDGIVNYLSVEAASIGFPELVVPAVLQLKAFLKKCKVPNYTKKIKHLLDKVKENQDFIESRRKDVTFAIGDRKAVKNWEISVKQSGTPLTSFHASWRKTREKEHLRRVSNRVEMDDYNLPVVKKRELLDKQKAKDKDEFKELFADDDDDDDDDEIRFLSKSERKKLQAQRKEEEDEADEESEDEGEGEDAEDGEQDNVNDEEIRAAFDSDDDSGEDVVKEFNLSDLEA